jgi:hypothetical protein
MNDPLEMLRGLTAAAMEKAEASAFRPDSRPAFTEAEADITISTATRTGTRQDGSGWSNEVVVVEMRNISVAKVAEGRDPIPGGHLDQLNYDIGLSKRITSQLGHTIKHIASVASPEDGILAINGKRCKVVEEVVPAPKRSDGTTVKDKSGYDLKPTFYYRFTPVGVATASSNGHAIDPVLEADVLRFFSGLPADVETIEGREARSAAMKQFPELSGKLATQEWQQKAVAEGKLAVADGVYIVPVGA